MARNYNEMSDEELVALKQEINRELAQRGQSNKPKKPRVKKAHVVPPNFKPPPIERMSARFCRKCGHAIWETRYSGPTLSHPTPLFYVKGRGGKPKHITHCPNCDRKLSPGRLKYSDEIEEAFKEGAKPSDDSTEPDGTIWYKYCVECGHKIGLLRNSNPPQFFDEADRQRPITVCPNCNTPLKESDDVDHSDEQRALLGSVYFHIIQMGEEIRSSQREINQLLGKMKDKKSIKLTGAKAIIGVHDNHFSKVRISLKEQLAICNDYCQRNGIEVVQELTYAYNRSHKKLSVDSLTQEGIVLIVATMTWLTSHSHSEALEFAQELDSAGIHLEIIPLEGEDQDL